MSNISPTNGGDNYGDPLDGFTDREEILILFQQTLQSVQPGLLQLLAVKGNSGTGKTFLIEYLSRRICPAANWHSGRVSFAQATPDFRSILTALESTINGCVQRQHLRQYRDKRDEYNRRFDEYRANISVNQNVYAYDRSIVSNLGQNTQIGTHFRERELQLRAEWSRALIELSEESTRPLCLFIDGYERLVETAPDLIGWLWEELLLCLAQASPQPFVVMTCGWERPCHAAIDPFVRRIELVDFNLEQVEGYLEKQAMITHSASSPKKEREELTAAFYNLTKGHPLVLGLASTYFSQLDTHERTADALRSNIRLIDDSARVEFLEKRLLERLPEPYRSCLERGPVLRSFDQATLQALLSVSIEGIAVDASALNDRSYEHFLRYPFVHRGSVLGNNPSVIQPTFHELVRRVRLGALRQHHPRTKEKLHRKMVDYYKMLADQEREPEKKFAARLQYLYHALQLREFQTGAFGEWNELIAEAMDQWQRRRARSLLDIIRQLIEEGEPLLSETPILHGRYLICAASFLAQDDRWKEALVLLEQAAQLFEQADNTVYLAASLNNIGELYRQLGDFEQALLHHKQALSLREKLGEPYFIAQSLNNIGLICHTQGKLEQALQYYQQARALFEQVGSMADVMTSLNNIGAIYDSQGQLGQALQHFKRTLAYDEQDNNPANLANTLNNIGRIYRQLGDLEQALLYHKQALTLNERIGNSIGIATSFDGIGRIYDSQENLEQALQCYEHALALFEQVGNPANIADSLDNIGGIYRRQGNLEKALDYHEQGLALRELVGNPVYIATSFNNIGVVYYSQNEIAKALSYFKRALTLLEQVGNSFELAACLKNIGKIYELQGKSELALSYYRRAREVKASLELL